MKRQPIFTLAMVTLTIFSLLNSGAWLAAFTGVPDAPTAPTDTYGYTLAAQAYAWQEINTEPAISFSDNSIVYAGPFSMGFNFKFYENTYNQFYVNSNGLLTFGSGDNIYDNQHIPSTVMPQNLVAALWSWTELKNGKVYIKNDTLSNPKKTIVEWEQIGLITQTQTFQAILFETGDIVFQYKDLPAGLNEYTVGVEGADGVYGLQALYNQPGGLTDLSAMRIVRPGSASHVKILPIFQGGFAAQGSATYDLSITNTGELGSDRFEVKAGATAAGWTVKLLDAANGSPLSDTNSNSSPDTGLLAYAASKPIQVQVNAPAGAVDGIYSRVIITATSTLNPAVWMTATIQTAVPVQFAQVYKKDREVRLAQIWEMNFIDRPANDFYTGSSMGMEAIDLDNYLVTWENTGGTFEHSYTDIKYRIFNRLVGAQTIKTLTNGAQVLQQEPTLITADARTPSIAIAPDGKIALAWGLYKRRPVTALSRSKNPLLAPTDIEENNSNIYFNMLDATTRDPLLTQAINVTGDINWYGNTSRILYKNPMTVVTSDGRITVCWISISSSGLGAGSATLFCSFYAYNASQNRLDRLNGPVGIQVVTDPWSLNGVYLTPITGNRVLMTYTRLRYVGNTAEPYISYAIRNSDGTEVLAPTEIAGALGTDTRAIAFGASLNEDVLVTWLDPQNRIGYAYLNPGASYAMRPGFPQYFSNPDGRRMEGLSLTLEKKGRAVLTWLDGDDFGHLYMAVLEKDQTVVTQPMIFMDSEPGDPILVTSDYGYGNASYQGVYQTFLPITRK